MSGEAARLVSNLLVLGTNFEIAWDALISNYENKRFLVSAQLDRFMNLKPIEAKLAQGFSSFLAMITESLGALHVLGRPLYYWDSVLLHQLVRLLDSDTREAWEVKLGSSSVLSAFSQFKDFLIGQIRRRFDEEFDATRFIFYLSKGAYYFFFRIAWFQSDFTCYCVIVCHGNI